jgi:hypothetical protein
LQLERRDMTDEEYGRAIREIRREIPKLKTRKK